MNVRELSREQLDELRWTMWFDDCDKEKKTGKFRFYDISNITDEDIYKEFDHIDFVNDDFFCTEWDEER